MIKPLKGQRVLKVFGIDKSFLTRIVEDFFAGKSGIKWEISSGPLEDYISVRLAGDDRGGTDTGPSQREKELMDFLGPFVYAIPERGTEKIIGDMLAGKDLTISVAESCTGGLIGNLLTNVPGSSGYFLGGVIVYSNRSKIDLLNVSVGTIREYGAVSDRTVREMAEGAKKLFKSSIGLAVTGIAGPEGGSKEKPVGTVFIGLATEKDLLSEGYLFHGNREQIKYNSATMALDWIRRYLNGDPFIPGL